MKRMVLLFFALTMLASYQPSEPDLTTAHRIDQSYKELWATNKVTLGPPSSDAEFMRRLYLDLTGRIPTSAQAKAFLESKDPEKRTALIGALLRSSEHGQYYAALWTTLFLGHKKEKFVDPDSFQAWLEGQFAANRGWDQITASLITASGNLKETPELNWYLKNKLDAANMADDTARNFLGIQLGCARCHNHPHDKWKLEDFYGLAAFYNGLKRQKPDPIDRYRLRSAVEQQKELSAEYKKLKDNDAEVSKSEKMEMKERYQDQLDVLRGLVQFDDDNSHTVSAEIKGQTMVYPAKFLLSTEPAHLSRDKRVDLAKWITSPDNPYFAKAMVNRLWGNLMGKGLVDPVDDLGDLNTPSNPELLDFLAADFRQHHYDIRYMLFEIANTSVYQRSSEGVGKEAASSYERAKVQMLNADQLLNSSLVATSIDEVLQHRNPAEYQEKRDMIQRYYVFLFDNDDAKGGEQDFSGTIPQALFMLNGKMTNDATRAISGGTTSRILSENRTPEQRINELYLCTLSRYPTTEEQIQMVNYVQSQGNRISAYQDVFWALLNSNEFLFNH